jgi:hypothetical protein
MSASEMYDAIWGDDLKTVKQLIDNGFDLNSFHPAFAFRWLEFGYGMQKIQYEHLGVSKIYGDEVNGTPLICAAFFGRENIVMMLLSHGASSTLKNTLGESARSIAGHSENHNIVKLIKHFDGDNLVKRETKIAQKREHKEEKKEKSKEKKDQKAKEKDNKKAAIMKKRQDRKNRKESSGDDEDEEAPQVNEGVKNIKL